MKTKNVRVRIKDIIFGRIIYTAHPTYGIRIQRVVSKPYYTESGLHFFDTEALNNDGTVAYRTKESIRDAGINQGDSYNNRKTFFKLKHAKAYIDRIQTQKRFQQMQLDHEQFVSDLCLWDDYI